MKGFEAVDATRNNVSRARLGSKEAAIGALGVAVVLYFGNSWLNFEQRQEDRRDNDEELGPLKWGYDVVMGAIPDNFEDTGDVVGKVIPDAIEDSIRGWLRDRVDDVIGEDGAAAGGAFYYSKPLGRNAMVDQVTVS